MKKIDCYTVGELKSLIKNKVDYQGDCSLTIEIIDNYIENITAQMIRDNCRPDFEITDDTKTNAYPLNPVTIMNDDSFYGFLCDNTFGFMAHSISGVHVFIRADLLMLYAIKEGFVTNTDIMFKYLRHTLKVSPLLSDLYIDMHLGICESTAFGSGSTLCGKMYPFSALGQLPLSTSVNLSVSNRTKEDAKSDFIERMKAS